MDINKTIKILEALASGCSPTTGEMITSESVLNERDVIRALQIAIDQLKSESFQTKGDAEKITKLKEPFREIDFFRKEKFNKLTDAAVIQLKEKVNELGILKTTDLPEYVQNAKKNHPRAYEPWSEKEMELLKESIKYTNDLYLLSQCFQRGEGSIESCGQKLIQKSQNL